MNVGDLAQRAMELLAESSTATDVRMLSANGRRLMSMQLIVATAVAMCAPRTEPSHKQIRAAVRHLVARGMVDAVRVSVDGDLEWRYAWLGTEGPWARLTARQREVARLMVTDHTRDEIATMLGLSRRTIDSHRAAILDTYECKSALSLYRLARERGWVS